MSQIEFIREVDPSACISKDVRIGAYSVIGPNVTIGPGNSVGNRVYIVGNTKIGSGNYIANGCVLGIMPQDLKYRGSNCMLVIGHNNRIGRNVTVHIGTEPGGFVTRIGDGNVFGEGAHVAHDCFVDSNTRIGVRTQLAGHILIQSGAVLGDLIGVHHFVTIGRYAYVGARTPVRRDVPPFTSFYSSEEIEQPCIQGIHEEGIASADLTREEEAELRRVLSELFEGEDQSALQTKIEILENLGVEGQAKGVCEFCQQSLQGKFGRHRETYRGAVPPEAEKVLPQERLAELKRMAT